MNSWAFERVCPYHAFSKEESIGGGIIFTYVHSLSTMSKCVWRLKYPVCMWRRILSSINRLRVGKQIDTGTQDYPTMDRIKLTMYNLHGGYTVGLYIRI